MTGTLVLGTRASALAMAQTALVREALQRAHAGLAIEVKSFTTRGDRKLDLSLLRGNEAGGKGLFTKELEDALLSGAIDIAVHSLKDLPGKNPQDLQLAAVLERTAAGDMLVAKCDGGLAGLPEGAQIGTSSVRRAHQLRWMRPDLLIEEWRGNVQTRLRKLGESRTVTAIVLAQAGLERLGYSWPDGALSFEGYRFPATSLADRMLPAIGQGVIALQTRASDRAASDCLRAIHHEPTFVAVRAERELQRLLDGDCTLPIGVRCGISGDRLSLSAMLFRNGVEAPASAEASGPASDPERVAAAVFAQLFL